MTNYSDKQLITKSRLLQDFDAVGIEPGMTLLVHSSLSSLGWVCGGAQAVVEALQEAVVLGVGHECNTSLHLAEYRWSGAASRRTTVSAPMMVDGERRWVDYEDIDHDESDFGAIGEAFEQTHDVHVGRVGEAEARLASQPQMVDFALRWMETERG